MAIKVITRIRLPYVIRMETVKKMTVKLSPTDDLPELQITFYPNLKDETYYNDIYSENTCLYIEVEAISNKLNFEDYKKIKKDSYFVIDVPEEDRKKLFFQLAEEINVYLYKLNTITGMFWVEDLPVNPLSGLLGKNSSFIFLKPTQKIDDGNLELSTYLDDYQETAINKKIKQINEEIISRTIHNEIIVGEWNKYLNKAQVALFESKYEECIINCAIAAEAFIKEVVGENSNARFMWGVGNDIVLDKLINSNGKMVDKYYNVILKYLFKNSLLEVEPELHRNLTNIFTVRNTIMHGSKINSNTLKKIGFDGETELNFDICYEFLKKLYKTVNTVRKITFSYAKNLYNNENNILKEDSNLENGGIKNED
ncbi:hypothetical protein ACFOZ1_07925 [Gracilibacillus marinus]|uniref:Apea-like HEPN domain-containing protein n=1 Tax=Gracilibacillus marinus TaxID=630535 RepID=A0ABV8VTF7_9BACI